MSPVLATIDVPVGERSWAPQESSLGHRTREAADMVRVSRTRREAAQALQAVTPIVPQRQLTVPPPRTGLVDVKRAGFACLGFPFQPGSARKSGTRIPRMWPGPHAMPAIRRHMREQTERRGLRGTMAAMVAQLNLIRRGWRHSCRGGHSTK